MKSGLNRFDDHFCKMHSEIIGRNRIEDVCTPLSQVNELRIHESCSLSLSLFSSLARSLALTLVANGLAVHN